MFSWLEELYRIRRENRICESCENLKQQLSLEREEKKILLDKLLKEPEPIIQEEPKEYKPILPRMIPWNTRKHMLEAESKKQAQLIKQNKEKVSTEDFEKELNIVEKEREKENAL